MEYIVAFLSLWCNFGVCIANVTWPCDLDFKISTGSWNTMWCILSFDSFLKASHNIYDGNMTWVCQSSKTSWLVTHSYFGWCLVFCIHTGIHTQQCSFPLVYTSSASHSNLLILFQDTIENLDNGFAQFQPLFKPGSCVLNENSEWSPSCASSAEV